MASSKSLRRDETKAAKWHSSCIFDGLFRTVQLAIIVVDPLDRASLIPCV